MVWSEVKKICKIWILFYSRETERDGHIKQTIIISGIENRTTKISPKNCKAQKKGGSPSGSSGEDFIQEGTSECTLLGNKYLFLRRRELLIQKPCTECICVWYWEIKLERTIKVGV